MNLSDVKMSALDKYKKQKSGNGPASGADKELVNSDTSLVERNGTTKNTSSDYFKKRKDKQTQKGVL